MPVVHEFMNTDAPSGKQLSLGIDDDGSLYVNGERVITQQKVRLDWWVNVAVVLGALGAFAQGLVAVYSIYK
ncbi:MAG: hypothetical protein HY525_13460 [Betaproteobacteria bacterium]|nr:hypothetical protein [Betaproteobacteria bacterium]